MSTALAPLWAIGEELQALLDSVDTCPDDLQPELQAQIATFMALDVQKIDQVAHALACLEYAEKNRKDEAARLLDEAKSAEKARKRLESYVCRVIAARGVKQLAGKTNTLSVRPSDAVVITDANKVPGCFRVARLTMPAAYFETIVRPAMAQFGVTIPAIDMEVSKSDIKKALKAGDTVPGADLEFRSNLVRR